MKRSWAGLVTLGVCAFVCSWVAAQPVVRGASPAPIVVEATRKVALVVGVSHYARQPLPNPLRDAQTMQKTLQGLGFEVILVEDGTRTEIVKGLERFKQRLPGAAVGLFFFAGHGVQLDGQNFLIPRDTDLSSEDQVKYNTVRLDDVIQTLDSGGASAKIVILDACRNNPFERARGNQGGLAVVSKAPEGTLIAYATSPGRVALDGEEGGNGLYTSRLVKALGTPGLSIEEVFKQARAGVAIASRGIQIPWESTSLTGSLVLLDAPERAPSIRAPVAQASSGTAGGQTRTVGQPARPAVLKPGDAFRDCAGCPEMVVVPPGRFSMGSPLNEAGRHPREGPQVSIEIKHRFAVARFELSFAEWSACLLDSSAPGDDPTVRCSHWPDAGKGANGDLPVVKVSWEDAQNYVRWLSRRTGRPYRLLSEAEWEYVARAGSTTSRPWGDDIGRGQAVCRDCGDSVPERASVRAVSGLRTGHPWQVQDLLGNVWEWVDDCRNPDLTGQPADGRVREFGNCAERVIRGGAWMTQAKGVRSASRSFLPVSRREPHVGFRIALTLDPAPAGK